MSRNSQIWTAMTAVTIPVPASINRHRGARRHLVGIGLFNARCDRGKWRFSRYAYATPAGHPGGALLHDTVSRLPVDSTLIGWNIDRTLMPALLKAAATAPPIVASSFLVSLHRLVRGGVVDLALGNGSVPLATFAADQAIYAPTWNTDVNIDDWAAGWVDRLRHDLADEALAIWRVFVRSAGLPGIDAEAATDAWVARAGRCGSSGARMMQADLRQRGRECGRAVAPPMRWKGAATDVRLAPTRPHPACRAAWFARGPPASDL